MLLEFENVSKTYRGAGRDVRALDGVSLSVDRGQFLGVQGPSGCGKTTLLLIAGGLLAPDAGRVRVGGEDPYLLPADARARFRAAMVGLVFQQFHLVPYLSVLDNVMAASVPSRLPDARQRAQELLARFGLEQRLNHVPAQISTGERQRTALARAVLNRPKLLLADEPTGNLDAENAAHVLELLAEFAKDAAVLLVSHDEQALEYAGRVVQMRDGRMLPGTPPKG